MLFMVLSSAGLTILLILVIGSDRLSLLSVSRERDELATKNDQLSILTSELSASKLSAEIDSIDELRQQIKELTIENEKLLVAASLYEEQKARQNSCGLRFANCNDQTKLMRDRYQVAMHDHVDALRNMSETYKRHAESIYDLDNSAIGRIGD